MGLSTDDLFAKAKASRYARQRVNPRLLEKRFIKELGAAEKEWVRGLAERKEELDAQEALVPCMKCRGMFPIEELDDDGELCGECSKGTS